MSGKAGRPRVLPEAVRRIIVDAAIQQQDMARDALADILVLEIEKKGFVAPSFETLKKYISTARSRGIKSLDYPWSIGSCLVHNIPPENIPTLIEIKEKLNIIESKDRSNKAKTSGYLSIRGALWLFRLIPIVKLKFPGNDRVPFNASLILIVDCYAREEAIHEVLKPGEPFDTSELDNIWFNNDDKSFEDRNSKWDSRYLNMIGGSEDER